MLLAVEQASLAKALAEQLDHILAGVNYKQAAPDHDVILQQASQDPRCLMCLLEVKSEPARSLETLRRLTGAPSPVPVVAVLPVADPELALRSMRIGACGCLVQPFSQGDLEPLVKRAIHLSAQRASAPSGKVVALASLQGGCGGSIVAMNLAAQASRRGIERVLLADFDPLAGTLAFSLKLKPARNYADILRYSEQLDPQLWQGAVTCLKEFDLLAAPELPLHPDFTLAQFAALFSFLRQHYPLVLCDLGCLRAGMTLDLACMSDLALLVAAPTLSALYAARRWLPHLAATGLPPEKVKLVLNRYRRHNEVTADQIESVAGSPILAVLPEEPEEIRQCLLAGKPASACSQFGKQAARLWVSLFNVLWPGPPAT